MRITADCVPGYITSAVWPRATWTITAAGGGPSMGRVSIARKHSCARQSESSVFSADSAAADLFRTSPRHPALTQNVALTCKRNPPFDLGRGPTKSSLVCLQHRDFYGAKMAALFR